MKRTSYALIPILAASMAMLTTTKILACIALPEIGFWHTKHAEVGQVTSIEISPVCSSGLYQSLRARVRSKCSPRDCTWGWTTLTGNGLGSWQGSYVTFSALRSIIVEVNNNDLTMKLHIDYITPTRQDILQTLILLRKE